MLHDWLALLQGLSGADDPSAAAEDACTVSIAAAHLPGTAAALSLLVRLTAQTTDARSTGVEVHGFHTASTSLPTLPWEQLAVPQPGHSSACVLLSEPHFTMVSLCLPSCRARTAQLQTRPLVLQVGQLAARLGQWMPTVGGVVKPRSFGPGKSLRGAVFLNGKAFDHGAVGAVLTGPFQACSEARLTHTLLLPLSRHAAGQPHSQKLR